MTHGKRIARTQGEIEQLVYTDLTADQLKQLKKSLRLAFAGVRFEQLLREAGIRPCERAA